MAYYGNGVHVISSSALFIDQRRCASLAHSTGCLVTVAKRPAAPIRVHQYSPSRVFVPHRIAFSLPSGSKWFQLALPLVLRLVALAAAPNAPCDEAVRTPRWRAFGNEALTTPSPMYPNTHPSAPQCAHRAPIAYTLMYHMNLSPHNSAATNLPNLHQPPTFTAVHSSYNHMQSPSQPKQHRAQHYRVLDHNHMSGVGECVR